MHSLSGTCPRAWPILLWNFFPLVSNHNFFCCVLCLLFPILSMCTFKNGMALSFLTLSISWLKVVVSSPQSHLFSWLNKRISLSLSFYITCLCFPVPNLSWWSFSGGQCVYISPIIGGPKLNTVLWMKTQMAVRQKLIISISLLLRPSLIISSSKFQEEISHGGRAGSCLALASCFLCFLCCVCPGMGT